MTNKRNFERIKIKLKVGYEFVKWNEIKLDKLYDPVYSTTYDISARGIGLYNLKDLKKSLIKQLINGKKKVRIGIFLDSINPPLITFARLIWTNIEKKQKSSEDERYGFVFLDVAPYFFEEMKKFVEIHKLQYLPYQSYQTICRKGENNSETLSTPASGFQTEW